MNEGGRVGRGDWIALAVVVVAGLVLRLTFLRAHEVIERDGTMFASVAESLARTGRLVDLTGAPHAWFPPGYPALMVPLVLATGDAELAGRLTSMLAALVTIVLVFLLARRLASPAAAWPAAILTAVYPPLLQWSVSVHSESAYGLGICAVALLAVRVLERAEPWAVGGLGLLVGAAYLVRGEGLALAGTFAWLSAVWLWRGAAWRAVGARAVLFALGLAVAVVPYAAYLRSIGGHVALSGKVALHLALARFPELGHEVLIYSVTPPALPALGARAQLAADVERYVRNAIRFEGMLVESASLLAVALAAVGALAWLRPPRRAARGILAFALAPLLICPFFLVEPKWLEPSMPLVLVLVGEGVVVAASLATRRRRLVMTLLTAALILRWSPLLAFPLRHVSAAEEIEQRWAGEWVRHRLGPGTVLMSRGPATAYYAGARWSPLPLVDLAGLRAVAEGDRVRVLVLDELLVRRYRPWLLPLLVEPPPPWLTIVHQLDPFPSRRVRIFTVASTR